jgi:endonuclease/exonuclease/phosphatase family metal-dependent hydrolase
VANTHLDSGVPDSTRFAAANELIGMLRRYESRPTILFGDLNDVPESRTLGTLEAEFADAWETAGAGSGFTYPSQKPAKRIDYVLSRKNPRPDSNATPLLLRPVVARIVASDASDHLPLIVEFTLSTE